MSPKDETFTNSPDVSNSPDVNISDVQIPDVSTENFTDKIENLTDKWFPIIEEWTHLENTIRTLKDSNVPLSPTLEAKAVEISITAKETLELLSNLT